MKKAISLAIVCSIAYTTIMAQYTLDSTRRMSPGVIYKHYSTSSPARNIHVMEIDLAEPTIRLQSVKSADTINGAKETVPVMYGDHDTFRYHDVTTGINSDFFTSGGPKYNPRHMMIGDGEILWDTTLNRTVFGITAGNTPFITKLNESYRVTAGTSTRTIDHINRYPGTDRLILYNRFKGDSTHTPPGGTELRIVPVNGIGDWKANAIISCTVLAKSTTGNMPIDSGEAVLYGLGTAKTFLDNINVNDIISLDLQVLTTPSGITDIKQLTGGWTRLVLDGTNCATSSVADEGGAVPTSPEPRTAIGFDQAKTKIYWAVCDGREDGVSEGMTLTEMADFMLYIGCYQALNLDGGGSSTMMGNDVLLNNPSDATGARAIPSCLLAYLTSLTLDNFETGLGHFNREPTYSSTTVGVSTSSLVTQALTCHSGYYSLIVKLYDNTSSSANWKVRLLSGSGIPSNNRYFAGTGTFSFYMKTSTANTGAKVRLWLDDNDGTELSPQQDVINDGQWHKYVWSLSNYNGTSTDGGNGVINSVGTRLDAIEFTQPNTSQTWFIFIDDIMVDPNGTEPTQVSIASLSPVQPDEIKSEEKPGTGKAEYHPKGAFTIFPNPSSGHFTIDFKQQNVTSFGLRVLDISGRTALNKKFTGGSQVLNLSELPPGVYVVKVTAKGINDACKIWIK